jgi:hypothetical protein
MSIANVVQLKCQFCGKEEEGRTNQRFCKPLCRSRYHNQRTAANRDLAEVVNPRAIAYAENVMLFGQLVKDNLLGPYTLDALVALGYCPDSPHDKQVNAYASQVTFYGNIRLKQSLRTQRYVLSVERVEKEEVSHGKIQRSKSFQSHA